MTPNIPQIFNRKKISNHKQKSHFYYNQDAFFHKVVLKDIFERLEFLVGDFENILLIDTTPFLFAQAGGEEFCQKKNVKNIDYASHFPEIFPNSLDVHKIENDYLSLAEKKYNLVIAPLCLHSINDLPGVLKQIFLSLKEDGVLIANVIGEQILGLFHRVLAEAELEQTGKFHPRVHPALDIRLIGNLLTRAGFTLPVSDVMVVPMAYKNLLTLFKDIRMMGESYGLQSDNPPLTRQTVSQILKTFGERQDKIDNRFHFDVDIITMIGRSPSDKQQKPLPKGSGQISMETALKKLSNI